MRRYALVVLFFGLGVAACRDEVTTPGDGGPAPSQQASSRRLVGWFHTRWGDPRGGIGAARVLHELVDDRGHTTELALDPSNAAQLGGPLALDRKRVHVDGEPITGGRLRVRSIGLEPMSPAATAEAAAPRTGSLAYVTIGCKFSDVAAEPHTIAVYQSWTAGTLYPGLNHHWPEQSYGQMNVTGSTAVGWYTLPQTRAHYVTTGSVDFDGLVADCLGAADAAVNFPQYYGINMQFNATLDCCSYGGTRTLSLDGQTKSYGMTWMADWADVAVYAHEEGHSLGLPHSSGPYGETYDSYWDVMSYSYPFFDAGQGSYIPEHTISYHKDLLGWIPSARKLTVGPNSSQTITLERLAQPGAGNYLMAQIPIDNAPGQFYTVEARRLVGSYDSHVPANAVVLHRVNPALTDRVAQVVDVDNNGNPNDAGAEWVPGETFTDAANAISVAVTAQTATGFQVTITRGGTPASDVWAGRAALATARSALALGVAQNQLFAIGGKSGTSNLTSVAAYNPGNNAWSNKAALPNARYDGNGAALISGLLYLPGGRNAAGTPTKSLFAYSLAANTWSTRAALPVPSGCGGSAVIAGLLYVLTGCDNTAVFTGLLHRYTPSTNSWTARATAPAGHAYPAVGVIGGKLYVAGGKNAAGVATATLHVYTPGTNTWAARAAMPAARFGAAGAVINGRLYVTGGTDTQGNPLTTTLVYDPATNAWSTKASMPTARSGLGAGAIAGLLYAVGGRSGTSDLKTVERYTP
jgi:M6 family metalloprotease-like protein